MEHIKNKNFDARFDAWRLPYACDACPSKIEPQFFTHPLISLSTGPTVMLGNHETQTVRFHILLSEIFWKQD